jgi:hypothetical protein
MLREDVVDAVAKGRFHIYAVSTLDEGLEVLTGMKAGSRLKDGQFPRGTVHFHVDEGLWHFHDELRRAEDGHGEGSDKPAQKHASNERQRPPRPTRKRREEEPAEATRPGTRATRRRPR